MGTLRQCARSRAPNNGGVERGPLIAPIHASDDETILGCRTADYYVTGMCDQLRCSSGGAKKVLKRVISYVFSVIFHLRYKV